ncbi:MAG: hypothetical protein K2N00_01560 [Lachnospiraceae bacterium]|nr:hypothetical protein [Lachnospiraceae bacterium]
MKKNRIACLCGSVCAAFGLMLLPAAGMSMEVQAAEIIATVQGKVMEGTTSELLFLDTSDGRMEIKIDAESNTSGCKILLPRKSISVSLSHGSDGYLHAVTISDSPVDSAVSVDMDKVSTVTGTVNNKTTEDVLHLDTDQGEMELKIDKTTDMSGCSVLVVSGKYTVRCARGEDAYMHAVSISDASAAPAADVSQSDVSAQIYSQPMANVPGTTRTVTGTVKSSTDESTLELATSEGDFVFKIDDNADTAGGCVLTSDNKLMVTFYRGSDDYLHASKLMGVKDSSSATVDTSSQSTVTGTVKSKSTENILLLDTAQGEMELKLDKLESLSGCKVLVAGKKISVTCARGSDAYMHALTITAVK